MKASKEVPSQKLSEKSAAILTEMAKLSTDELSTAYKIKPEQAEKEKQRWDRMLAGEARSYPAIELFNGLMYRHIKRSDLSTCEKDFLSQQVFITSSFYGIIPAFYPIQEHRHDFHTKVKINGQSLKNYWRAEYDKFLEESQVSVVSLLSNEFEDVFSPSLRKQLFTVSFMEDRNGLLKTHSTISKKARGAFLTAVMKENCRTIDALRELSFDEFYYRKDLSSDSELVFVKKVKKAKKPELQTQAFLYHVFTIDLLIVVLTVIQLVPDNNLSLIKRFFDINNTLIR